ncbi:MAG TPA: hypothetical protein VK348_08035 [Planctomycetota bacterium]|nr:hypothetical protein [Planctomycetota bacterium]
MDQSSSKNCSVIPRDSYVRLQQPAMIDCAGAQPDGKGPLTVMPLLDGDRIAGLEIKCGCGSSAVVEFVYEAEVKS